MKNTITHFFSLNHFYLVLTSTPVPQQVAVDILDVSVDGGPTGDAARGHVGVSLRVDILETLPGHTRAELWEWNLNFCMLPLGQRWLQKCFTTKSFCIYDPYHVLVLLVKWTTLKAITAQVTADIVQSAGSTEKLSVPNLVASWYWSHWPSCHCCSCPAPSYLGGPGGW